MAQYMLAVYGSQDDMPPAEDEMAQMFADVDAVNEEIRSAGAWVFGNGLEPADMATVVKLEGDQYVTTDGPFPEAKEQLGGFWIIEAADLDEALAWARKATRACRGPVEVRPFQPTPSD